MWTSSNLLPRMSSLAAVLAACGHTTFDPVAEPPPALEIVADLDQPPGNVAVTPAGRVLVSMHPFGAPRYKVLELAEGGAVRPFPDPARSEALHAVIGIRAGADGVVWMLDAGGGGARPSLLGWDSVADRLVREIVVPADAVRPTSFFQDFALDATHRVAFVADMTRGDLFGDSTPAIVAIDLDTGETRRLLEGHPAFAPDGARMIIDGEPVRARRPDGTLAEPQLGLNPITIDAADRWIYFGAMHGRGLYRASVADLLDRQLPPGELAARVSRVADKAVSDGITIDAAGNVYVTDLGAGAIGVIPPGGAYREYLRDPRLAWPDGFGAAPDGTILVTINQLHRTATLHGGVATARPPYHVARFRPLAPSVIGR